MNRIIREAKSEERSRILKIIKDMPNLEKNYTKLLRKIETPLTSKENNND